MNLKIDELLKKEMTRTEFLGLVGAGLLSLIGVSALMKNLGSAFQPKTSPTSSNSLDYGISNYGGATTGDKKSFLGQ